MLYQIVCRLQTEEKTVHKRQDSCGKAHVLAKTKDQRGELTCSTSSQNAAVPIKCKANGPLWFHQELVDTFEKFGEFRAFIVTEPDPKALRGRKGKIICVARTNWRAEEGAEMYIEAVNDKTFRNLNCEHLTRKGFNEFCLSTCEDLRRRPDWKERWTSLEEGVRMDVSIVISPLTGKEEFWVVKTTRWYGADFFSDYVLAELQWSTWSLQRKLHRLPIHKTGGNNSQCPSIFWIALRKFDNAIPDNL
ncbi:hypothetical protein B0J14DRAFT_675008 [Halenospora varia]|nr:hypothetical protein B0J14DRAFT_675008 [Halenospora varia]